MTAFHMCKILPRCDRSSW